MKRISNKNLRLNKINVSKLNAKNLHEILGGNKTHTCIKDTNGETCTTSRTTVDFSSNATDC